MIGFIIKTLNPELIRNHTKTVILIWVLFAFVPATFIMFTIFLLMGSFTIIDFQLGERNALLIDAFLSIIFFLQHSILVRRGFKQWLGKFMPDVYHNAFYGLTSGLALFLALIFWQKSPTLIARADEIIFWLFRALFCLCWVGIFWGVKSLGQSTRLA